MFAKILIGNLLSLLTTAHSGVELTHADAVPMQGVVAVSHDKGSEYVLDRCTGRTCITAEVAGGSQLSKTVAVAGNVSYKRTNETSQSGTAFMVNDDLRPFDIVIDTPGNNTTEAIDLTALAGWRVYDNLSLGGVIDYCVADRARTKDLRYSDSFMDLKSAFGLGFDYDAITLDINAVYRRSIESIAFSRAGTNDVVYTPLIDYGNGLGISESYNGTGFTDDSRQPLLSEYIGVSGKIEFRVADGNLLLCEGQYLHRKGHYGRDSQYTIIHDEFNGNCCNFSISAQIGTNSIEARCSIDDILNFRTNYLTQLVNGVTYYRYYEPTKTASKLRLTGELAYIGNFVPIDYGKYRWEIATGTGFSRNRVTSWLYPLSVDTDCYLIRPFVTLHGVFPQNERGELLVDGGIAYQWTWGDFLPNYNMYTDKGLEISGKVHYIFAKNKSFGFRPGIFAGVNTLHRYFECGVSISI